MVDLLEFLTTHEAAFRSRARLASLYSDFRLQRSTNPDNYAANSHAWQQALTSASRAGLLPFARGSSTQPSHLAFTSGEGLSRSLQSPQWGRPLALGAVIQDAVDKRELVPLQDFLAAKKSVYAKSWVPSAWQVVNWSLRTLGIAGGSGGKDKLAVGNFVVMANVEAAATAIMKQASANMSLTSRIYSRALFESEFADALAEDNPSSPLSATDFNIVLTYLARDRPILTHSATAIKFAPPNTAQPDEITEQDTTIANLRDLISSLTAQTEALSTRIADLNTAARAAVAAARTAAAKSALRSKRLAETTLTTRSAMLAQLEDVFASIEQAADQVAIVRVMQASGAVLRDLHKEVGGVEGVEGVVDALREEMEGVDEVGRVLVEGQAGALDEGEVDEEFEALERGEREKREERDRVERERREETEAEVTRARLAELEALGKEKGSEGPDGMEIDGQEKADFKAVAEPAA